MLQATEDQKKALRKVKSGPMVERARNCLVLGSLEMGAYIQFGLDIRTYNLWEAFLYAYNYESKGCYKEGQTQKALDSVISMLPRLS